MKNGVLELCPEVLAIREGLTVDILQLADVRVQAALVPEVNLKLMLLC